jgi:hypothetical protein
LPHCIVFTFSFLLTDIAYLGSLQIARREREELTIIAFDEVDRMDEDKEMNEHSVSALGEAGHASGQ